MFLFYTRRTIWPPPGSSIYLLLHAPTLKSDYVRVVYYLSNTHAYILVGQSTRHSCLGWNDMEDDDMISWLKYLIGWPGAPSMIWFVFLRMSWFDFSPRPRLISFLKDFPDDNESSFFSLGPVRNLSSPLSSAKRVKLDFARSRNTCNKSSLSRSSVEERRVSEHLLKRRPPPFTKWMKFYTSESNSTKQ
jgi:hypothetical protein